MAKRPTRKEKMMLARRRLNPANWLVTKRHSDWVEIMHRHTGRKRIVYLRAS